MLQTYYRLQSEGYDITPKSQSYEWQRDSLSDAMYDDLYETFNIDNIDDIADDEEKISKLWWEKVREAEANGSIDGMRLYAERGVSCFMKPKKLIEYFNEEGRDGLENMTFGNYILEFEGKDMGYGLDDEDIAKFENEIKRWDVEEFINEYK